MNTIFFRKKWSYCITIRCTNHFPSALTRSLVCLILELSIIEARFTSQETKTILQLQFLSKVSYQRFYLLGESLSTCWPKKIIFDLLLSATASQKVGPLRSLKVGVLNFIIG